MPRANVVGAYVIPWGARCVWVPRDFPTETAARKV
jgi:hypothetical protein